jgi:hypothetical protein
MPNGHWFPDWFHKWAPLILLAASGVMAWTVTQIKVSEAVPDSRFVRESLRVNSVLERLLSGQLENRSIIMEIKAEQKERFKELCVAVRAGCR